jgi:hypothetical protein
MISQRKINRLLLSVFLIGILSSATAQNFGTKNGKIGFFSSTPVEDIKAVSDKLTSVLIPTRKEVAFQVPVKSFTFAKGLMQEHFNENYLESDKYPYAKFKGNIDELVDFSKDGDYNVTSSGTLTVHGVSKQRTIPGKISVRNGKVRIVSSFDVACVDHNIKIPTLVITKVAEVIKVSVDATLSSLN